MSARLAFRTQLASIMEVLANAAVLEICKLVEDDFAVMSLQMSQCQRENKALKRKLHLLELRMARVRDSSGTRTGRVQVNPGIADRYRDYRAPQAGVFQSQEELYGRQLNEEIWTEGESSETAIKDGENVAADAGPDAVLVKAEASDHGQKRQELFIREDGVAEAVAEGEEAAYGAIQVEKADGHHTRTRRQALEPQISEDEEPDVLFIKEERSEPERTESQVHGGMSVQDGFVESSTDVCRSRVSSSPAQITVALSAEESDALDSSLMKEEKPETEQKTIQSVVDTQPPGTLHSRETAVSHRVPAASIALKVWDLPSAESHLQGPSESINNPLSEPSTQRRKLSLPVEVLDTNSGLYERTADVDAPFPRWTANNPSASQPSCSYIVDSDQDQDCVLVQPGTLPVRGMQEGLDGLPDARGPLRVEQDWAASTQSPQLGLYSRGEGVRLEATNRVTVSHSVPKITLSTQMMPTFAQPGFSLAGLQLPKRLERGKRKSYICKFCGKAFTGLSNVEAHQRVHTGEKPFKCETCGKLFAEAGNLKKHQRVHTGEKPFTCTRCGKRFAWICNLRTHQQSASCGGV